VQHGAATVQTLQSSLKPERRLCAEAEERDPETYDDAELYQQLLKEFLESSAGAGGRGTHVVLGVRKLLPIHHPCHAQRALRRHVCIIAVRASQLIGADLRE